jgi:multidrug efflux system outer membrane protein
MPRLGSPRRPSSPAISLTGFFGASSTDLSDLFSGPQRAWQFAGQLAQPIFTGGSLTGQLQAAEAVQQEALFNYQQVIQRAFAEVDDSLIAISKLRTNS